MSASNNPINERSGSVILWERPGFLPKLPLSHPTRMVLSFCIALIGIVGLLSLHYQWATCFDSITFKGSLAFTVIGCIFLAMTTIKTIGLKYFNREIKTPLNVCIQTEVHFDGWGDYFSLLNGAKILKEILPQGSNLNVYHYIHKVGGAPEVDFASYHLAVNEVTDLTRAGCLDLRGDQQTDLVITLPQSEVSKRNHGRYLGRDDPEKSLCIGEYSSYYSARGDMDMRRDGNIDMGLDPDSAGIFLPEVSLPNDFSTAELRSFFNQYRPYFCYAFDPLPFFKYVLASHDQDCPDYFISKLPPTEHLKTQFIQEVQKMGVSKIIYLEGMNALPEILLDDRSQPQGKTITIVNPFPLSQKDFLLCIHRSQDVVGCQGDLSFSEALSLGKVPFYDIRPHKAPFWGGFIRFAERNKKMKVAAFARQLQDGAPVIIPDLRGLKEEFHELTTLIREKHLVKNALRYLINHKLFAKKHPWLAEFF